MITTVIRSAGSSGILAIGALAVAAVSFTIARHNAGVRKRAEASAASIEEAVTGLESAAFRCVTMLHIDAEAQEEAGESRDTAALQRVWLPKLVFSDALELESLPLSTRDMLRDVQTAWAVSEKQIADLRDCAEAFSVCDYITLACAQLGRRAWTLAQTLRRDFRFVLGPQWAEYELAALDVLDKRLRTHERTQRDTTGDVRATLRSDR